MWRLRCLALGHKAVFFEPRTMGDAPQHYSCLGCGEKWFAVEPRRLSNGVRTGERPYETSGFANAVPAVEKRAPRAPLAPLGFPK